MRGEGTRAEVSRAIAESKACLSRTTLFQHGQTKEKTTPHGM